MLGSTSKSMLVATEGVVDGAASDKVIIFSGATLGVLVDLAADLDTDEADAEAARSVISLRIMSKSFDA